MSLILTHCIGFGIKRASGDTLPGSYGSDITSTSYAIYGEQAGGYPATNAFDANTATNHWCNTGGTGTADGAWVGQDFGSGVTKTVRKITIVCGSGGGANSTYWPDDFQLQYSDDSSSWTAVNEWYSNTATQSITQATSTVQAFEFKNGGAHRYWRIKYQTNNGFSTIGELEMFEAA